MKTAIRVFVALAVALLAFSSLEAGRRDPVAVLFQVKGDVEYSRDGKRWRKVRRNKFLFAGYHIKSGDNGSGKITIKQTGKNLQLTPGSVFKVTAKGIETQQGNLEKRETSSRLVSGLLKKFSRSQSYTTVRRSANKDTFDAVRSVRVSDDFPFLVWDNLGSEYSYRLTVGDAVYDISPTDNDFVRVRLNPFSGTQVFKLVALKDGEAVTEVQPYRSRGEYHDHTVEWLNESEAQEVKAMVENLSSEYGEDTFMLGTYYEKEDMWVAAMDQYRRYLAENPDDYEMTPYLFRVYKKLKLDQVYEKELEEWNVASRD